MKRVYRRSLGWLVHLFTASGACIGVLTLFAIYEHHVVSAFWLMAAAIFIDAVDGMFARMVKTKEVVPEIDGALLDNIVDFVNYTIVPSFLLLVTNMLPDGFLKYFGVAAITLASAYQFTQADAKTTDHFFKGFPSYWNIVVFYLYLWQFSPFMNLSIILLLSILSFVPIKYVYPSRLDYLTRNQMLRYAMVFITFIWSMANLALLWMYPSTNQYLLSISIGYLIFYLILSLYRTCVPLDIDDAELVQQ